MEIYTNSENLSNSEEQMSMSLFNYSDALKIIYNEKNNTKSKVFAGNTKENITELNFVNNKLGDFSYFKIESIEKEVTENPKTADTSPSFIVLFITIMLTSIVGLVTMKKRTL